MSAGYWVLHALLLGLFGWWLRRARGRAAPGLQRWLLPALGWRLLFAAAFLHWPSEDAVHANFQGRAWQARLLAHPAQALPLLQEARTYADFTGPGQGVYRWSQTVFFDKLLGVLDLLNGGAPWVAGLYLSLGCFVACWSLVHALQRTLPQAPLAAGVLAFLLWPTVLWWTAGMGKETVLVGCAAGCVALLLPMLYPPPAGHAPLAASAARRWARRLLGLLALGLLAWLMTRVRYFFALPLLGGLVALAGVRTATRRGWLGPGWPEQAAGVLLGLGLLLAAAKLLGGVLMSEAYFVHEVNLNYHHGLATSTARPHIEYAHWQPSVVGLLAHAPLAAVETLIRPWPGESALLLYVGAGLENALLALLVGLALLRGVRGRPGPLPPALVLVLVLYCLLLAAFIGLSTPNLGTLNRYRAVLLPWLLWLVLSKIGSWRNKSG